MTVMEMEKEISDVPAVKTYQSMRIADMKIAGYRAGTGNTDRLFQSIKDSGMIHPIVLAPDRTVLSGERRIHVARMLGKTTVPYVFVSNMTELLDRLRAENEFLVGKISMRRSEIAHQASIIIDANLLAPTHNNGRYASTMSVLADNAAVGVKDVGILSALVLLYRAAHFGADQEERTIAYGILQAIEEGGTVTVEAQKFREYLRAKHPGIRIDYTYTDKLRTASAVSERTMSATERHGIIDRFVTMLEDANRAVGQDIIVEAEYTDTQLAEWDNRIRDIRITLNKFSKSMRGRLSQ